jgi:hypothetical protein
MKNSSGPDPYEIPDNGRRGAPISGCDCVQCFGRCMVDPELRFREGLRKATESERAGRDKTAGIPI